MKINLLFAGLSLFALPLLAQESDPERQFDFWIGTWDVYHATADTLVGKSSIESILFGTAIQEHYQNPVGAFKGTSLNKFNATLKVWEQFWVDNTGTVLHLRGNLEGGNMVLFSDPKSSGTPRLDRVTWKPLPENEVRQTWEISKDEGETWIVVFDGIYRKSQGN